MAGGTAAGPAADLTPEQVAECQRRLTACEVARQAYQDWLRATLGMYGIDADRDEVRLNPWTGRVTVRGAATPAGATG